MSVGGGTGVRELTRGLATLPQRWIQEPLVVRDSDGRPQEDFLAVHCFCVCSRSALFGDLFGVSRSMESDILSFLSINPRIFLHVFIVYCLLVGFLCVIVFYYMFMCVNCFGLVVSTCQVIGYRKTSLMTSSWGEEIISTKPRWKKVFVYIFLLFHLSKLLCVPPGPAQYIFHMPMARYSIFVLKVPLNTNKTNNWRAPWKNRTSRYISFFPAHHSLVFYFRCSVYWWKGSVRF